MRWSFRILKHLKTRRSATLPTIMQSHPAPERNKSYILKVLQTYISADQKGILLEIASGTGQHAAYFSQNFKNLTWQPSDMDDSLMSSVSACKQQMGLQNVNEPIKIDATTPADQWNDGQFSTMSVDFMFNSNMTHISPWAATVGLFKGCKYLLKQDGLLFMYGPYAEDGELTPESNVNFDKSLRQRNPEWGIRDTQDIARLAEESDLTIIDMVDMPANNKTLIFQRKS